MKKACIIGAGFGGLALAIRLQAAGIETTLVEARDQVGGRAGVWQREGFTFDAGPTVITDPNSLRDLWSLTGHDIADDIELIPVMPFYRLNWTDGVTFDYSNDDAALRSEISRVAPQDIGGYEEFLHYAEGVYQEGYVRLGDEAFLDFASMVKAAPAMIRYQAWRSVYSMVSHYVKDEHLRQALSFHTLLVGGNPMTTSAIYALIHKLEKDGGVWWARGGTNKLAQAMARQFERIGGTVRLGDKVSAIHTIGDHVAEVECESGWRGRFDAVASNGDIMHTYRDLLAGTPRGQDMAKKLAHKRFTPSVFVVHFGLEGTWPGIPHHSVLFGPRYKGLLDDIYEHGVLPRDFSIYLHHPSVTDPGMAPAGKSTFYALIPVANLGKLPVDWKEIGPVLERRVLAEVSRRLIPDLEDRLVTSFHYAPSDFESDYSAYKGNAFSLEPLLTQSAWLRGHNRDDKLKNFYLVGAGTHPGAGIPGVVASARATARLMVEDLK